MLMMMTMTMMMIMVPFILNPPAPEEYKVAMYVKLLTQNHYNHPVQVLLRINQKKKKEKQT